MNIIFFLYIFLWECNIVIIFYLKNFIRLLVRSSFFFKEELLFAIIGLWNFVVERRFVYFLSFRVFRRVIDILGFYGGFRFWGAWREWVVGFFFSFIVIWVFLFLVVYLLDFFVSLFVRGFSCFKMFSKFFVSLVVLCFIEEEFEGSNLFIVVCIIFDYIYFFFIIVWWGGL